MISYRNRLILSVSAIFVAFAVIAVAMGVMSGNSYKRAILLSRLESYTDMVARADSLQAVLPYLPSDLRMTLISTDGNVLYDSEELGPDMPNHLTRPEIRDCMRKGYGWSIRKSDTAGRKYFYFARLYDGTIVRTAQVFEVDLERFLRTDWLLLLLIFLLLVLSLMLLVYLSGRYEREETERADSETRRLKHEMTGNISHELKTPVSSIQGYLETIVNHPELDEDRRRLFIERSYLQAVRLSEMISDISTITKLEENPGQFRIAPVNIRNVFSEVLDELAADIEKHRITVENTLPPVCVRGNYNLIYSIFRNLVENTLKYAGDGSSIFMDYRPAPGGVHEFDYRDTGRGVDDSQLEKIFGRFYRIDSDRGGASGGSGLGLSIVRNAVNFHRGTVTAYGAAGGGLGFRFTLRDMFRS